MKANTRAKQREQAKEAPHRRPAQIQVAQDLPNEAIHAGGGISCAPGLGLSPIGRWPCPGCQVGETYPYAPPLYCPFEPVTAQRERPDRFALSTG